MDCPEILRHDEALRRAVDALSAARLPELAAQLSETPSAETAYRLACTVARELPLVASALGAFAICADELPNPPPPRFVVAVE